MREIIDSSAASLQSWVSLSLSEEEEEAKYYCLCLRSSRTPTEWVVMQGICQTLA